MLQLAGFSTKCLKTRWQTCHLIQSHGDVMWPNIMFITGMETFKVLIWPFYIYLIIYHGIKI
jgi:hypothetical protein